MSRSTYTIRPEPHVSPPAVDTFGNRHPPMVFAFSVRRPDGSLLFRARTEDEARNLVVRLYEAGAEH